MLIFVIPIFALAGAGLVWAVQGLASGKLLPKTETFIAIAVVLLYAAVRIPLALHVVNGAELARALGIRRAAPEPGEPIGNYAARTLVGFAIGVLVRGRAVRDADRLGRRGFALIGDLVRRLQAWSPARRRRQRADLSDDLPRPSDHTVGARGERQRRNARRCAGNRSGSHSMRR